MENNQFNTAAITAELQEMVQKLHIYNQRLRIQNQKYRKYSKKLPSEARHSTGGKMALINEAYKIALENPAVVMEVVPPGEFIQGVKDLKDMMRMVKRTTELRQILEGKITAETGPMTRTTTGTTW